MEARKRREMRKALVWAIDMFSYYDRRKGEFINTLSYEDNHAVLNDFFGFSDSAAFPEYAFDGCVLQDAKGFGALQ